MLLDLQTIAIAQKIKKTMSDSLPSSSLQHNHERRAANDLTFSEAEVIRYSRHILLPNFGAKGQAALRHSRVLVVGAGGLGSPALFYLAAAGVGTIGISDYDRVELSNLQRQILHSTQKINTPKLESALQTLKALNPDPHYRLHPEGLKLENIESILKDYDLVLDGSDNFATRFLVNDACFFSKTALISAAVFRFEGQLSSFDYQADSPCYRCLYPAPPAADNTQSCSEAGVLGSVVGTLGTLQATEAMKHLSGIGSAYKGKLLQYDGLNGTFHSFGFTKQEKCALCGSEPSITTLREEIIPECTS